MLIPRPLTASPAGSRWLVVMTVLAVYICMIDRIAISIAIIPMAEQNGWSPTVQGAVMSAFFLGLRHAPDSRRLPV
jgi:ACS family sodium-dependent inorganic phosphate cotransporter